MLSMCILWDRSACRIDLDQARNQGLRLDRTFGARLSTNYRLPSPRELPPHRPWPCLPAGPFLLTVSVSSQKMLRIGRTFRRYPTLRVPRQDIEVLNLSILRGWGGRVWLCFGGAFFWLASLHHHQPLGALPQRYLSARRSMQAI